MIIVANGAYKSGSTWLFHIAREITGYGPPPEKYAALDWTSRPVYSVHRPLLAAFLEDVGSGHTNILIKNHFGNRHERDCLLRHPQVQVLNISRDIRDVVVSAFYHRRKSAGVSDSERYSDFRSYYWKSGRFIALRVLDYQIVWEITSPRYLRVEYDKLLTDFTGEIQRIGAFLGIPMAPDEITHIQQATSPTALAERYGDDRDLNRFRKGQIGDWKNHFDEQITVDIDNMVKHTQHPLHRLALNGPGILYKLYRRWRFHK